MLLGLEARTRKRTGLLYSCQYHLVFLAVSSFFGREESDMTIQCKSPLYIGFGVLRAPWETINQGCGSVGIPWAQ